MESNQTSFTKTDRTKKLVPFLKTIFGAPLPFLIGLYALSLMTTMSGMEIFGWGTCAFGLIYIAVDFFSSDREFEFFRLGSDLPMIGLLIVGALGLTMNAPNADFWSSFGALRWIMMLYLMTYALDLTPSLNRILQIWMVGGTIIAGYAIFQHFTGQDLRQEFGLRLESAVTPAPFQNNENLYQSVGLFGHHLTYGYSFGLLFCFPFAALALSQRKPTYWRVGFFVATLIIGMSLVWTYGRGVWMATAAAMLLIGSYVSRKYLISLLVVGTAAVTIYYYSSEGFRERLDSVSSATYHSNSDRRELWKANIAMFQDNPWLGVGYLQNETLLDEYMKRLGLHSDVGGHAHNTYFNFLATTGFLGLSCYLFFVLSFLLMTHRLWLEVPRTHFWHRVIVLGALGAQIHMHIGGLTQCNFLDAEVNHLYIMILAVIAYMSERYARGIVPDDYAL